MWSPRVLLKYWALQLPATVLIAMVLLIVGERFVWPLWVVWTLVAIWVAKDAILYAFSWRAYDARQPDALPFPMEGMRGIAVDRIDPAGRVRVWGELWYAELAHGTRHIEAGEPVLVTARDKLTLLIEPAPGQ